MTTQHHDLTPSAMSFPQERFSGSRSEAKVYRGYSSAPASASEILSRGATVEACSMLHETVHAFRRMHRLESALSAGDKAQRDAIISQYPLALVSKDEASAIAHLSAPERYAAMRHGGRSNPGYAALSSTALSSLCQEIRAALVWRALQ
jgi:hypothetical protein